MQAAHSYAGRALSTHEQIAFENAAQQTHIDEKLALVPAFWGKIEVWGGGKRVVADWWQRKKRKEIHIKKYKK